MISPIVTEAQGHFAKRKRKSNKSKMRRLIFLLVLPLLASCQDDENPGRLLYKAGMDLMEFPLHSEEEGTVVRSGYEVRHPRREDLAISRLEDSVIKGAEAAWAAVRDPQLRRILERSEGGAAAEVLRRMGSATREGARRVEAAAERSGAWGQLWGLKDEDKGWKETMTMLNAIVRKVDALYGHLDSYMENPGAAASEEIVLEDFALAVAEPGSSQDTSLAAAVAELRNLTVPGLGLLSQEDGSVIGEGGEKEDAFNQLASIFQVSTATSRFCNNYFFST